MHLAHFCIACVLWLCAVNAQVIFDKSSQSPAITSMVNYIPPGDAEEIKFTSNSISHIPGNYFINLSNLNKIHCDYNAISTIQDRAFSGVPSVTYIDLRYNQLTIIRKLMFSGLPNLDWLSVRENFVHTIEPGSFHENTALALLAVRNNQLETLSQCIFHPSQHPTALDLFTFKHNPLHCDNRLCWIKHAEADGWITVSQPYYIICTGPAALASRKWDTITTSDLGCGGPPPGE